MVQRRNIDGDYFLSKPCQWLVMEHVFTVRYVTFSVIWYGVTLNEMFIIFSIVEMFWPLLYETFFICTSNFPWHCIINMVSIWFDWVVTVRRGTMGCWRCKDAGRVGGCWHKAAGWAVRGDWHANNILQNNASVTLYTDWTM